MHKILFKLRDVLFLAIGALFATVGNNWTYFKFNSELNVSDLFTAVLGGYLGLYIGGKLSSRTSSERIEKDLLISEITPITNSLIKLYSFVENNTLKVNEAVQFFKSSSQSISNIKTLAIMCNVNDKIAIKIEKNFKDMRRLNTMVTRNGVGINDLLLLPLEDLPKIVNKIKQMRESLTELMIAINRM